MLSIIFTSQWFNYPNVKLCRNYKTSLNSISNIYVSAIQGTSDDEYETLDGDNIEYRPADAPPHPGMRVYI